MPLKNLTVGGPPKDQLEDDQDRLEGGQGIPACGAKRGSAAAAPSRRDGAQVDEGWAVENKATMFW